MTPPADCTKCIQPNPCRISSTSTSSYLYEVHPTNATFDGVHLHDDLLEDWSRQAIEAQIRDLGGFARRLARHRSGAADRHRAARAAGARAEHPRAAVRSRGGAAVGAQPAALRRRRWRPAWPARRCSTTRRSPSAPGGCCRSCVRCRASCRRRATTSRIRPASSSRSVSRACAARCASSTKICRARSATSSDLHLLGDLADASTEAADGDRRLHRVSRDASSRRAAKGSFRLGRDRFEQKLRLDEGIDARRRSAAGDRHARAAAHAGGIPPRGLARQRRRSARRVGEDEGRSSAGRPADPGRAAAARRSRRLHQPAADRHDPRTARRSQSRRRRASIAGRLPACGRRVRSRRGRCARSTTSPTSIRRGRPSARTSTCATSTTARSGRSRSTRCFPGTSSTTSTCARSTPSCASRSCSPRRRSSKGWAHYCEQMMIEEGFRKNDHAVRLGQLAEALIRLCRFIVGIRLHCEDMSVEQGVRFFREEAFLEEASARREAERGTFDPSYILYSRRQADAAEAARGLQGARRREVFAARVPRHAAGQRHGAGLAAPRADARRAERRNAGMIE